MFIIKYIGMYLLVGIVTMVPLVFGLSFYMMHLSKNDDEAYWTALDIITDTPHAIEEVERMSNSSEGKRTMFVNMICNIATWPVTIAHILSRVPEAKAYILERQNK